MACLVATTAIVGLPPLATAESTRTILLKGLSLEELVNVEVTTLSKKSQSLSQAAAAVYVITADEIVRSGYTSIPQLLKHVPGLQVAQVDGNQWVITSRGFAGEFSQNKLLVLIDGRSVYTRLFSAVLWDVQDILLDDIERIEVIRGPGGSLWGANAVNGIINIITKHADETIGGHAQVGAGTHGQARAALRYGHRVNDGGAFRVFAKYSRNGVSNDVTGLKTADDMEIERGGVRYDQTLNKHASLLLRADAYTGQTGATNLLPSVQPPYQVRTDHRDAVSGGSILLRLSSVTNLESEFSLQGYLDVTHRDDIRIVDDQIMANLDFSHRFRPIRGVELTWGLGYRGTQSRQRGTYYYSTVPHERFDNLWTAFAQSELPLAADRLTLTLGSKLEHNGYTGFEYQPSARVLWTTGHGHSIWAAVSRVVRTPSRIEQDGIANWIVYAPFTATNPGPLPLLVRFTASAGFESEAVVSYELGHRASLNSTMHSDVAVFYSQYDNLFSPVYGTPEFDSLHPTYVVIPATTANGFSGISYGLEWSVDWVPSRTVGVRAGYTRLTIAMSDEGRAVGAPASEEEGLSPENQLSLRLSVEPARSVTGQLSVRFVDRLPFSKLDSYWTLDTRIAVTPTPNVTLSLVGQNLFNAHQVEFHSRLSTVTSEVPRGFFTAVRWSF